MRKTLVSFGDVGLDRETENLTVRYSSVWPGAVLLGRPERRRPVFEGDGHATLLEKEEEGTQGGSVVKWLMVIKRGGFPFA
jgi:hypothetical protein